MASRTLWVVADQHPQASGTFYKAVCHKLVGSRATTRYLYEELGALTGFPDGVARRIRSVRQERGGAPSDLVLLVFDTEEMGFGASRRAASALRTSVARELCLPKRHVFTLNVVPMTEAVYLLDDAMLAVLSKENRPRRGRRGPQRAKDSNVALRQLAERCRSTSPHMNRFKHDLTTTIPSALKRKRQLATQVAEVIRREHYVLPDVECFRILRGWLDRELPL